MATRKKKKDDDGRQERTRSISIPKPPTIPHGSAKGPVHGKMTRGKLPMKEKPKKGGS